MRKRVIIIILLVLLLVGCVIAIVGQGGCSIYYVLEMNFGGEGDKREDVREEMVIWLNGNPIDVLVYPRSGIYNQVINHLVKGGKNTLSLKGNKPFEVKVRVVKSWKGGTQVLFCGEINVAEGKEASFVVKRGRNPVIFEERNQLSRYPGEEVKRAVLREVRRMYEGLRRGEVELFFEKLRKGTRYVAPFYSVGWWAIRREMRARRREWERLGGRIDPVKWEEVRVIVGKSLVLVYNDGEMFRREGTLFLFTVRGKGGFRCAVELCRYAYVDGEWILWRM